MPSFFEPCRKSFRNSGSDRVGLSQRELQLAQLVSQGRQNKEISYLLGLTEGTVKAYLSALFAKLGASNRAELSAWAVRHDAEIAAEMSAEVGAETGRSLRALQAACSRDASPRPARSAPARTLSPANSA